MKKRVLSFFLCLCLCAGMLPCAALASDEAEPVAAVEEATLTVPAIESVEEIEEDVEETPEEPVEEVFSVDGDAETYTVTMNVVYPEDYEGEKTGGLRVYEQTVANGPGASAQDFSIYTDYVGTMPEPVIRNVGETFWYTPLAVDGMTGSVDMNNAGAADDYYALYGEAGVAYTVTVTYTEGASGEPEGPLGPPDPPAEDWIVDFELVYEGTDPGTTGGGINVYNEDGTLRETVTASGPITVPGGTKFLCLPLDVKGLVVSMQNTNGMENGRYARYESGTVTAVYTADDGSGSSGPSYGPYTVTMEVVYPDGYTGAETGGLRVYDYDVVPGPGVDLSGLETATYTDYTASVTLEKDSGEVFWYSAIRLDGYNASISVSPEEFNSSSSGDGYYSFVGRGDVSEGYTVTVTYGTGGPGEGPTVSEEDYEVSLSIEYDAEYTGEKTGGITLYSEDGTAAAVYTDDTVIQMEGGVECLFIPIAVDGLYAFVTGAEKSGDYYVMRSSGDVVIQYADSPFYIETKDMAADGSTVGSTSATLTAIYSAPSDDSCKYYDIELVFGVDKENMSTYHRYVGSDPGGEAYLAEYDLEVKGLLPDTTYYYQAYMVYREGTDDPERTIYGTIKSFTTDAAAIPCYEISPINWNADEQEIPCSVIDSTDTTNTDLGKLSFTAGDADRGSYLLGFTVDKTGTYHFDATYNGVIKEEIWSPMPEILMVRLYTKGDNGGLAAETGGGVDKEVCFFYLNQAGTNEDHTEKYLDLEAGVEYYLLLDTDGETVDISVSYANWMESDAQFALDVTVEYEKHDSRPACMRAMAVYSVSEYYDNGYALRGTYGLRSVYEENGTMPYTISQLHGGLTSKQTDALMRGWMNYCIPGLEYVYELYIVDNTTGAILATTGVQSFTADMPDMYSLQMGENINTYSDWKFGGEGYMYKLQTGAAGYYHIGVNDNNSVVEFYNVRGELLKSSTSGSFWTSASCELEGETLYYVYISCGTIIKPIVTVSQPNGTVATDDSVVTDNDESADIARETLEGVLNQLTKDGSGNAAELPSNVEADETGETALRTAIETGESLTAEITGEAVTEDAVEAETAAAMEEAALNASGEDTAEAVVYLELSVILKEGETELACITETEEEITFAIPLTEELREQIAGKSVYIVREHEGVAEVLEAEVSEEDGYIYFSSSLFSTFALFTTGTLLNGFVEEDGVLYYFIDGIPFKGGLFEEDGAYYYARTTNGEIIRGRSYWTTCTNGLLPAASYTFDEQGRIEIPYETTEDPGEDGLTGIYPAYGSLYYYEDGALTYKGLMLLEEDTVWGSVTYEAGYYYVRTSGEVVNGRSYWITKTNELLPAASYEFDAQGCMIMPEAAANGFVEENGVLHYYMDGVLYCGGLFALDGEYYYARTTNGEIIRGRSYWITCTNGLLEQGLYEFDAEGKILLT